MCNSDFYLVCMLFAKCCYIFLLDTCGYVGFRPTAIPGDFSPHSRAVARLTFRQQFAWPTGDSTPLASPCHQIGGAICCLPGSIQHGASDDALFMEKSNNSVDVSGFTRFSRDGTSLQCPTTYSRSCVCMMVAFSDTSVYAGPSLRTGYPALGDESASGTTTTGAISPLQNACPSVFGK
ncbi:hypothetical protein AMECASPLE_029795 [Ameca splendens]|uniref:Secreted protein n=1 Tax=Ameca splendens TaxID=208324 RepID=A0ABV0XV27_9TELE